jgi:hypothetical protein
VSISEHEPPAERSERPEKSSFAMICLRYVLPAVVVLAGIVVMSLGSESELEGGAGIAGAGLAIFAMNWLIRKASDDRERAQEEAARDYFDVHGRWPDEVGDSRGGDAVTTRSEAPAAAPTAMAQRRLERPAMPRSRGSHGR